ncbi:uncharacterized protein BDW47DRAFT_106372 [Aspergillus candidus]|uniref:Nucleotidyl transferase AbiEii toxin, Type IV TA system n=1 Tax=Aspergillus candidus TaxID=41067 RepID=A0A2I2FAY4_ASPCN|nr:hypothetical protein BDW47DRAFT_106372 [Aspergillus candidus]PLB37792.1 hypothetical protein BDW47DRAFT_106372 [Aspergillus candidus]
MSAPTFPELEQAAGAVILILKSMPEFADTKIAIIGGLSLWKYIEHFRSTEDVDFLITVQGAPNAVKEKLLALPDTPFKQHAQLFFYVGLGGKAVQVDITPSWQSPYLPQAAIPISSARPDSLPYISEIDLLVFKINSCGLRPTAVKKMRDVRDARTLVDDLCARSSGRGIVLSEEQKSAVLQGLDDVVALSRREWGWWAGRLGLVDL